MGRPQQGDERKTKVSVMLSPALVRMVDEERAAVGATRSAYIERTLSASLADEPPPSRPRPRTGKSGCSHDRERLTVLPYMTCCDPAKGGCGARLR